MQNLPVSRLKGELDEYVDAVQLTHDGAPAAVLVSADEWESIQETLHWLSKPGIPHSIAAAEDDR